MNRPSPKPDAESILDDAWGRVVGGMEWLRAVLFGEFVDNRPLSAVIADMLVSFVPGVVIVTSARDAVAVILRLASHPEKREELMEWVLLCACLIVIALPVAMAVGGAVGAGVGTAVGGILGSELGAALRAVMLLLINKTSRLVDVVLFLQQFIKGDVLKLVRAVKFSKYDKALIQALNKFIGKLVSMVNSLRAHLESLRYFDSVKVSIARLAEWERKFYSLQQDALRQIPKALVELDVRLSKVLAETLPKEMHTIASGVQTEKNTAKVPALQRVRDTPGKIFPKVEDKITDAKIAAKEKKEPKSIAAAKSERGPALPMKDAPDPAKRPGDGPNTKRQAVADAAAAADRVKITQLSNEARDAARKGNTIQAAEKLEAARDILRPYLPRRPEDGWEQIISRLDVSSPRDGAVFWSGDPKAAQDFAESIGGVTLETTAGGRVIDNWGDLKKYNWDASYGPGPYSKKLWLGVSEKYAEGVSGHVYTMQTQEKLRFGKSLWHNNEKPIVIDKMKKSGEGAVTGISMHISNGKGGYETLGKSEVKSLMEFIGDDFK